MAYIFVSVLFITRRAHTQKVAAATAKSNRTEQIHTRHRSSVNNKCHLTESGVQIIMSDFFFVIVDKS